MTFLHGPNARWFPPVWKMVRWCKLKRVETRVEFASFQLLKLTYDEMPSSFAICRYKMVIHFVQHSVLMSGEQFAGTTKVGRCRLTL